MAEKHNCFSLNKVSTNEQGIFTACFDLAIGWLRNFVYLPDENRRRCRGYAAEYNKTARATWAALNSGDSAC